MIPREPGLQAWLDGTEDAAGAQEWLQVLDEPAWLVDVASCTLRAINRAGADWLGQPAHQWPGTAADELLPTLEDAAYWAEVRAGRVGRLSSDLELPREHGGLALVHRSVVPMGGAQPHSLLVRLRDRSAEAAAALERETLLAELRATLEATADGILVTDLSGHICAFNRRFATLWELPEAALADRSDEAVFDWMRLGVLQPADYQRRLHQIGQQLMLSTTDHITLLSGITLERQTQPQWSAGRPIGRVWSFRESGRKLSSAPREIGTTGVDSLTLWPNRSGLLLALDEALARPGEPSVALLCLSFDAQALFAISGRNRARALDELVEGLRACAPAHARVARLGGARFAVMLQQGGESAAERLAERLQGIACRLPAGLLATEGLRLQIGIAATPRGGGCAEDLLVHAEAALQRNGRDGGGRGWTVHTGLADDERQHLERLERAVREGLADDAFRLHWQPRVDARTGQVVAAEALLRWHDPVRGLQLPAQFLGAVQRLGLMVSLDDWALERALHQAVAWRQAGMALTLCVNVSAASLGQPGYARRVAALLESTGWAANMLELDLQESALQADAESALFNLQALHRLGVRMVLDNVGASDTALALWRRFPLAAVKLDRSLVRGLQRATPDTALAQAIVAFAQALKLPVYAVGVDNEVQRRWLCDAGCAGWQGQLCAPALDVRGFEIAARPRGRAPAANEPAAPEAGVA
ncbi:EAL domain-containing protein [Ideonella margarita]|uniref:EAL domain-containing protein n=1 Tax=Ideonella margarita TaxID=2984191 RepID=A0ABU9C1D0_9BURK